MFRFRRFAFQCLAVLIGLRVLFFLLLLAGASSALLLMIMEIINIGVAISFTASILTCWYFLFRSAHRNAGTAHAIGHLLLSVILTPIVLLGVILIPILIRGDANRIAAK